MVSIKVAVKTIAMAALLSGVGALDSRAADLTANIRSAEACLTTISKMRGTIAFGEMNLGGFARKLANDINYADAWRSHDPERALALIGSASCEERLSDWSGYQNPKRALHARPRATGSDGTEMGEAPVTRISDTEYYLMARQKAVETIARIQSRPYMATTYSRR